MSALRNSVANIGIVSWIMRSVTFSALDLKVDQRAPGLAERRICGFCDLARASQLQFGQIALLLEDLAKLCMGRLRYPARPPNGTQQRRDEPTFEKIPSDAPLTRGILDFFEHGGEFFGPPGGSLMAAEA